jgi:hypothetical protein
MSILNYDSGNLEFYATDFSAQLRKSDFVFVVCWLSAI